MLTFTLVATITPLLLSSFAIRYCYVIVAMLPRLLVITLAATLRRFSPLPAAMRASAAIYFAVIICR